MMETKRLLVKDGARQTAIIAIRLTEDLASDFFTSKILGPHPRVIVIRLADMKAGWDPFVTWQDQALIRAHRWLELGNWDDYTDMDTITVGVTVTKGIT